PVTEQPTEMDASKLEQDLVFSGLIGMIDPSRDEVKPALKEAQSAGIRSVMITGDYPNTAKAIAEDIGLLQPGHQVLMGHDIDTKTPEEMQEIVKITDVYARVSPEHKMKIVDALRANGEIVAMTGDGVNDAPAIKRADIGVAMGITGTDVAKETADMVAADDNFASIFAAVLEGRVVYDNIRKATFFLIPTGLAAILSLIGAMFMGLPAPYLPIQLLWINLVTNGLQDVALAFEPAEPGIIERQPRNPKENIMTRTMLQRTLLVGVLIAAGILFVFHRAVSSGQSLEHARTLAVTVMVFFQFFQAWNSRSERLSIVQMNPLGNPFLAYSMLAALLAQLAVIYEPFMGRIFSTTALTEADWLLILPVAATVLALVEADKFLRARYAKGTA
ncbi:MAG TPA: HAD-IC family P-type ATPase, partial [Elusimicrobiales bacterium]|nr:HAD-IC family P-type ATPase [Elusimicrobiales bacterium]